MRDEIANKLRMERSEVKYNEFIQNMRDRTYIDRRTTFDPGDFRITSESDTL